MALENIQKNIIEEAEKQASDIITAAEQNAAEIKKQWEDKRNEKRLHLIEESKRKTAQKIQQTDFLLHAQTNSEILNQKNKIIDKVYKLALQKLKNLNESEYIDFIAKLIEAVPSEGILVSVAGREELLKKALKKTGKKLDVAKETIKGGGGFIYRSEKMEINNTFEALIDSSKESTLLPVSTLLFGNQE